MQNVYHYESTEKNTYNGSAGHIKQDFSTLRTGIDFIDQIGERITNEVVNYSITSNGGTVLTTDIYNEESSSYGIPTYNWSIDTYFYFANPTSLDWKTTLLEVGAAIVGILTGVWWLVGLAMGAAILEEVLFGDGTPSSGGGIITDIKKYFPYIIGGTILILGLSALGNINRD